MTAIIQCDNKKIEISFENFVYIEDGGDPSKAIFLDGVSISKETWGGLQKWLMRLEDLVKELPSLGNT